MPSPFDLNALFSNPSFQNFLNQGISSFFPSQGGSSPSNQSSFFGLPRGVEQLGGAASLIASLRNQPSLDIPRFSSFETPRGTASADFLQHEFQSPSDPFAPGGVFESSLPALKRQESDVFNEISTRYPSMFPANVGVQGPELQAAGQFGARAAENRQSIMARLLNENLDRRQRAAGTLLGTEKTAQAFDFQSALDSSLQSAESDRERQNRLAQLGIALLSGRQGQGGFPGFTGPPGSAGVAPGSSPGGGPGGGGGGPFNPISRQTGQLSFPDLANSVVQIANQTGDTTALEQLLVSGRLAGTPFPVAVDASTPAGQIIQQAITRGLVESPAATSASSSLLGTLGTSAGAVGIGAGGFFTGRALGPNLPNQSTAVLSGAATGAAEGALIGSIVPGIGTAIGAIIGGLAGGAGGFFGKQGAQQAQKAEFRTQDVDSQRGQVNAIGNIGSTFLQELGVDQSTMDSWGSFVQTKSDTVESPEDEQGQVATRLGEMLSSSLGGSASARAPQLRQRFIDYMMTHTFTAGNSRYSGGAPENLIQQWGGLAQLKHGGRITRPTMAIVGEDGPELAYLSPGSSVMPFLSNQN